MMISSAVVNGAGEMGLNAAPSKIPASLGLGYRGASSAQLMLMRSSMIPAQMPHHHQTRCNETTRNCMRSIQGFSRVSSLEARFRRLHGEWMVERRCSSMWI